MDKGGRTCQDELHRDGRAHAHAIIIMFLDRFDGLDDVLLLVDGDNVSFLVVRSDDSDGVVAGVVFDIRCDSKGVVLDC